MLKIKDGFDLDDLVRYYDFDWMRGDTYAKYENVIDTNYDEVFVCEIVVNPVHGRRVKNEVVIFFTNVEGVDINREDIDMTAEIDTIFDLIKAGIIEKV